MATSKTIWLALFIPVIIAMQGCRRSEDVEKEQWQTDEVLIQLMEIRKEMVSLRKEM